MDKDSLKLSFKALPKSVKRVVRGLMIPPLRAYFRYVPSSFGKKTLWDNLAAHLWWMESQVKVATVFGSTVCVDAEDLVGKYIYYFGIWEPNLTHWIRQRLMPGDVFIDVGANIGYYSLLASKLVGESGKVVAIEALPQIFKVLKVNLEMNCARNVRPVNIAAWDSEELLRVFTQPENLAGTTTLMPKWADQWHLETSYDVHAAPLSTIITPDEIKAARLIKIDVEGAEWHAVSGLASMMHGCRSDLEIIVEVAPRILEEAGKSSQDLLDFFRDWGFYPYRIENDYAAAAYFARSVPCRPERIERIRSDVADQTDVIFSRVDAESL